MKILDKFGLVFFSIIIMILSVIVCVVVLGWLELDIIIDGIKYVVANEMPSRIALIVSAILGVYAIKCIFFNSFTKEGQRNSENILLESENGKLLVSKDTIENITNNVVKNYEGTENVITKVNFDNENNLSVYITLFVKPETVIKDLAAKLQSDVKAAIKNSIDLDIKSVNIRIKNIITPKDKTQKQQD